MHQLLMRDVLLLVAILVGGLGGIVWRNNRRARRVHDTAFVALAGVLCSVGGALAGAQLPHFRIPSNWGGRGPHPRRRVGQRRPPLCAGAAGCRLHARRAGPRGRPLVRAAVARPLAPPPPALVGDRRPDCESRGLTGTSLEYSSGPVPFQRLGGGRA